MDYEDFHGIEARSAVDALGIAAANGLLKEMQLLLDDGVDINSIADYSQVTPLASAARNGQLKSVNFLLEHGADVNLPSDTSALTPLMMACHEGKVRGSKIALRLLEAGADANCQSKGGMTALSYAVECAKPEVLQALIDHGAAVDGPPGSPLTPLMLAARENNVESLKVLVENGADLSLTCPFDWAENRTALGIAELEGCKKAAKYLASVQGS